MLVTAEARNSPWHSRNLVAVDHLDKRLVQLGKLDDTLVRVIFATPHGSVRTSGVREIFVREDVLRRVPTAVTQIETTHEGNGFVDHTQLLMLHRQQRAAVSAMNIRVTNRTCRFGSATVTAEP